MNVLFILYHNFKANSAIQVHNFANGLCEIGVNCIIAVPNDKQTVNTYIGGVIKYHPLNYDEVLQKIPLIFGIKGPDIIHVWTPREIVRKFCEKIKLEFPYSKIIIDLEDNEEIIVASNLGTSFKKLENKTIATLDSIIPESLSHPIRYKKFLSESDGVTVIMDSLLAFVPKEKKNLVLWPILDIKRFGDANEELPKEDINLKKEKKIILSYIGNVHSANYKEVRSLYLAVALANREGIPTKLIRAGTNYVKFWGEEEQEILTKDNLIELGFIPNHEVPSILMASDILIQPGEPSVFNDYRLPSKLVEFLASGKPVALPSTNLGRFLKDGEEAILLDKGNALDVLSVIRKFKEHPAFFSKIGEKGKEFAIKNFDKDIQSMKLLNFYKNVLNERNDTRKKEKRTLN